MQTVYKDFWIRIIGSLVGSQVVDFMGRLESFFNKITSGFYYADLLSGFIIAFILWKMVRRFTILLDTKYDWLQHTFLHCTAASLLSPVTSALQSLWLNKYAQGPLEFVWRKLAYYNFKKNMTDKEIIAAK